MEEKNYCIYVHQNKINGKLYIGQTKRDPEKRWLNGRGYKDSPRFNNAIQKYGWDNFNHIIILEHLTQAEANEIEKFLIHKYNTQNDEYGYNIGEGGEILPDMGKRVICIETGVKYDSISEAARITGISRANIGNVAQGIWLTAGGYHWIFESEATPEEIQKRLNRKSKTSSTYIKPARKVRCKENNMIFNSIGEAERFLGIKHSHISDVCNGKRNSSGKLPDTNISCTWEYVD